MHPLPFFPLYNLNTYSNTSVLDFDFPKIFESFLWDVIQHTHWIEEAQRNLYAEFILIGRSRQSNGLLLNRRRGKRSSRCEQRGNDGNLHGVVCWCIYEGVANRQSTVHVPLRSMRGERTAARYLQRRHNEKREFYLSLLGLYIATPSVPANSEDTHCESTKRIHSYQFRAVAILRSGNDALNCFYYFASAYPELLLCLQREHSFIRDAQRLVHWRSGGQKGHVYKALCIYLRKRIESTFPIKSWVICRGKTRHKSKVRKVSNSGQK